RLAVGRGALGLERHHDLAVEPDPDPEDLERGHNDATDCLFGGCSDIQIGDVDRRPELDADTLDQLYLVHGPSPSVLAVPATVVDHPLADVARAELAGGGIAPRGFERLGFAAVIAGHRQFVDAETEVGLEAHPDLEPGGLVDVDHGTDRFAADWCGPRRIVRLGSLRLHHPFEQALEGGFLLG